MKFAIIIPTYQRKDGKTPTYLRRCINSVLLQTYKNYKLFIVGDKYENDSEILDLIPENAWYKNLDHTPEREKYSGLRLWDVAGVQAAKYAFEEAISQGYQYLISLDHDDYLDSGHLQLFFINRPFAWACTKSIYKNNILPKVQTKHFTIDFLPTPGGVVHSSVCYDYKQLPLLCRNVYEETGIRSPADFDLWERMAEIVKKNNLRSIFINNLSCYKEDEGYARIEFP